MPSVEPIASMQIGFEALLLDTISRAHFSSRFTSIDFEFTFLSLSIRRFCFLASSFPLKLGNFVSSDSNIMCSETFTSCILSNVLR